MKKNAFYAQSGGVTAVINATAGALILEAKKHKDIGKIYAGKNGILGALNEELIDTSKESISALEYISLSNLANSYKTFLTIILSTFFGKNFSNFEVVIHNDAFVEEAKCLYLIESKKVKSSILALFNVFTSWILLLVLNLTSGKNFFIRIFFFLKKIFFSIQLFKVYWF